MTLVSNALIAVGVVNMMNAKVISLPNLPKDLTVFMTPEPLVPLNILRNRIVLCANLSNGIGWASVMSLNIYLPMFLQAVHGLSPTVSGLHLASLMMTVNGLRLVMGTLLDVTDDGSEPEFDDEDDPLAAQWQLYGWLGWFLEWIVDAQSPECPCSPGNPRAQRHAAADSVSLLSTGVVQAPIV